MEPETAARIARIKLAEAYQLIERARELADGTAAVSTELVEISNDARLAAKVLAIYVLQKPRP